MRKVVGYVDGFNLYHGMDEWGEPALHWLNVVGFLDRFLHEGQELVRVHYFSAPHKQPEMRARQDAFWNANGTDTRFTLHLGYFRDRSRTCVQCAFRMRDWEEKKSDVHLAVRMLQDVHSGLAQESLLVSADSDFVPVVQAIRKAAPLHRIHGLLPPNRHSADLCAALHTHRKLGRYRSRFRQSQLPESLILHNGHRIHRPDHWAKK